jgi:hypothetical protein
VHRAARHRKQAAASNSLVWASAATDAAPTKQTMNAGDAASASSLCKAAATRPTCNPRLRPTPALAHQHQWCRVQEALPHSVRIGCPGGRNTRSANRLRSTREVGRPATGNGLLWGAAAVLRCGTRPALCYWLQQQSACDATAAGNTRPCALHASMGVRPAEVDCFSTVGPKTGPPPVSS